MDADKENPPDDFIIERVMIPAISSPRSVWP